MTPRLRRLADSLGMERNVVAVSAAALLLGFGENLWKSFFPKYLQVLGAPVMAVGLYGTLRDVLDGAYQYPGGWIADRWGSRRALRLFIALAGSGYAICALAGDWPLALAGTVFVMAWAGLSGPAIFALIGDALPRGRRAAGFTVQSLLKRLPVVIAPALGGLAIAAYGVRSGVRLGLVVTVALALATLAVVARVRLPLPHRERASFRGVWRAQPTALRRLLASDILIRTCEGMVDVFLVIYVTAVMGVDAPRYGLLVGLQMATSILVYLLAGRLADRFGRKPFVIATFLFFAAFPVAVVMAKSFSGLLLAYVVGGLREIGEPARKAMIVDLSPDALRARSVGLYYLLRSLAIAPAALAGGALWRVAPTVPFFVAGAIGLAGTALFAKTVEERYAA